MEIKKIILAGGTGFLGNAIINKFNNSETQIIVLTRGVSHQEKNINYINWDGKTLGNWVSSLESADVLINLTGKSVDCRYTEKNKAEILFSRINATRVLGEAIKNTVQAPRIWLNCSSEAIYRSSEDKDMDEFTQENGSGFSYEVSKKWEQSFYDALTPKTRKIVLRISMVLGNEGGVIPVMKKLVKSGLGGKMGDGKQYVSWIHEEDFLNAISWLIQNESSKGAYNLASPEPIPNKEYMRLLRKHLHVKFGLPASEWMIKIGAFFINTEPELILTSRRVVPTKLLKEGFTFKYSTAEMAIKILCDA